MSRFTGSEGGGVSRSGQDRRSRHHSLVLAAVATGLLMTLRTGPAASAPGSDRPAWCAGLPSAVMEHLSRFDGRLNPVRHPELAQQRRHMCLDRDFRQVQGAGDALVGHALGQQ